MVVYNHLVLKNMKSLEHDLQVACVQWFRMQYPRLMIFAVPNGGERNIKTASRLKNEGVLSGVADLCILVPNDKFHGLFIEMKYGKNKQSQSQIDFQKYAESHGYAYCLCYDFESFICIVNSYLK